MSLQIAYRTQKCVGILDAAPKYASLPGFPITGENFKCFGYSPCGRLFAWATTDTVFIINPSTGDLLTQLCLPNVLELSFSPKGTFLITCERPGKDDTGDAIKNLKVWYSIENSSETEKIPLGRFVQKSQGGCNLQYTADEQFCARIVTNEVHIYQSHNFAQPCHKLRLEGIADFALGPGFPHSIAAFVPERKGQPATVKVYNISDLSLPVSQKNFFKGDKVQLKWNKEGTSILVLAQTDVDKSNKSYYGETTLYLLSTNGDFDARIPLDKEGPIHDVAWSPNSREFGVIYGYMPAKTTIFNHRAVPAYNFPIGPRNTFLFSPTGRFALIAGFGNLAGQVDVYDLDNGYRKICTIESGNPSVCQWSPDGQYIVTATTSPRLRVDNGIKVWHVNGQLVYNEDMCELYNVTWQPWDMEGVVGRLEDPLATTPLQHESAVAYLGTVKAPGKLAGVYRPPGARGLATPLHFKREDEGGTAHTVSNGTLLLGSHGFGRGRRIVPGSESMEMKQTYIASRQVPGSEPVGDEPHNFQLTSKSKKKRNAKKKDTDASVSHQVQSVSQQPLDEHPELFNQSISQDAIEQTKGAQGRGSLVATIDSRTTYTDHNVSHPTYDSAPVSSDTPQNPLSKKLRSLYKKVRAIEDLEMRLAGGAKLEDTQLKKILTKDAVQKELHSIEKMMGNQDCAVSLVAGHIP